MNDGGMAHSKEEGKILKATWEFAYRKDLLGVSYFNITKSNLNQSEKNYTYKKVITLWRIYKQNIAVGCLGSIIYYLTKCNQKKYKTGHVHVALNNQGVETITNQS